MSQFIKIILLFSVTKIAICNKSNQVMSGGKLQYCLTCGTAPPIA